MEVQYGTATESRFNLSPENRPGHHPLAPFIITSKTDLAEATYYLYVRQCSRSFHAIMLCFCTNFSSFNLIMHLLENIFDQQLSMRLLDSMRYKDALISTRTYGMPGPNFLTSHTVSAAWNSPTRSS